MSQWDEWKAAEANVDRLLEVLKKYPDDTRIPITAGKLRAVVENAKSTSAVRSSVSRDLVRARSFLCCAALLWFAALIMFGLRFGDWAWCAVMALVWSVLAGWAAWDVKRYGETLIPGGMKR